MAGRPARERREIEALERMKGTGMAQEDQVVDGYDGGARGENWAYVHRAKEKIEAEAGGGERHNCLLPSNADGGAPRGKAAGGKGEVRECGEVFGDGAVADEGGEARRRAERRHASKD